MLYQLPNGRTINISLKEYLDMTDQDLKSLNSMNIGNAINSPFLGSAINGKQESDVEDDIEDESPELLSDDDDINVSLKDAENLPDEGPGDFDMI